MEKSKLDLYLTIGVIANLLLVGFFVYIYFNSMPAPTDLIDYRSQEVSSLSIYNEKLDKAINQLKKTDSLPINVDPNEIGKDNPYGQ